MSDLALEVLLVGLIFMTAGAVKGVVGLGLPIVAIGLLTLTMAPASAAALLVVPSFATNFWQAAAGPHFWALLKRLAPLMLAIIVGTLLSIGVLTGPSAGLANAVLGAVLIVYGTIGLAGWHFRVAPRIEPWLSPLMGFLTGLIAGATGVFAIPLIPYLNSLGFAKNELIQALGLAFLVSTFGLAGALSMSGSFHFTAAGGSLLAVLPALAGMFFGQRLRDRIHADSFRRWFFVGLVVLGIYMLGRGLLPR